MTLPAPFDIRGKRTIVTGAAMGIGFGIARRFVEAGAHVLAADRDEAALASAAKRLEGGPGRFVPAPCDVAQEGAGAELVRRALAAFGGVDVLVNNAGIFPQVPTLEMSEETFDRVIRVNLRGLVFISKAVAAQMVRQGGGGKIVNIGSIDSFRPSMVGLAAYDASKGAVLMFTKNLALELARHDINVNLLAPGGIETEGTQKPLAGSGLTAEQMAEIKKRFVTERVPLRRMGDPDDIAKAALFLSSPASDYMTGASIVVDGGALLT